MQEDREVLLPLPELQVGENPAVVSFFIGERPIKDRLAACDLCQCTGGGVGSPCGH
ncbi:MAG: hypothetical protein LBE20_05390 [Deltaproteobacteria bacterium]|jgi:hypothetical protein|nr:hypothetical protein [Deltaproteobacteria bacterium]